jgi:hypothetical protein
VERRYESSAFLLDRVRNIVEPLSHERSQK